eukprot:scaffold15191_cov65-Phaeocystis_antarctica.AAC.3
MERHCTITSCGQLYFIRHRVPAAAPRSAGIGGRSQRGTRRTARTSRVDSPRGRHDRSPGTTRTCAAHVHVHAHVHMHVHGTVCTPSIHPPGALLAQALGAARRDGRDGCMGGALRQPAKGGGAR